MNTIGLQVELERNWHTIEAKKREPKPPTLSCPVADLPIERGGATTRGDSRPLCALPVRPFEPEAFRKKAVDVSWIARDVDRDVARLGQASPPTANVASEVTTEGALIIPPAV